MKLKDTCSYDKPRQGTKKWRYHFANKGAIVKAGVFPVIIHVQVWELDHKEGWAPKNGCFWTVVLETLESPLDSKENKPVNPKGNQPWILVWRTDAEAEAPILWPPDGKRWLAGKDWLGKIEGSRKKGNRRWDGWMALPNQWAFLSKLWETVKQQGSLECCRSMGSQRARVDLGTEQQIETLINEKEVI